MEQIKQLEEPVLYVQITALTVCQSSTRRIHNWCYKRKAVLSETRYNDRFLLQWYKLLAAYTENTKFLRLVSPY